ncbi:MAG: proline--tRNA ligase [Alphaproteobacteria bacterium]|nr:MAG: proline--tRNA ligase [Alphaproteobacteria bacterium]
MRRSQFFIPTLKETPKEATIPSHRLMLRSGMIHQTTSGIYSWLPLGQSVLANVSRIIKEEMDNAGAQHISMPTIQPAFLWEKSGRYDAYGKEMLRMRDRHDRDMLYGPTAEEVVTDLVASYVTSYKQLPFTLYQINAKFRDEIRPRFGVMRGREFTMKDAYSFDCTFEDAQKSYEAMFQAYIKTFRRMSLNVIPVKADPGAIGGNMSHEFHVVAETGESGLYYEKTIESLRDTGTLTTTEARNYYAASDDMHDPDTCPISKENLCISRGIEVGHIFYLGTKYTEVMNFGIAGENNTTLYPHMGCYGIGVTRVIGALIETFHDKKGICWPSSVAPFLVGLINIRIDNEDTQRLANTLYTSLKNAGISVLYDDRNERSGGKFADMDLIGCPWQVTIGPRDAKENKIELKNRHTEERQLITAETLIPFLKTQIMSDE